MLTKEETEVLKMSADLWNAYLNLPVQHLDDTDEFRRFMHSLQHLVMIREARRNNPVRFNVITPGG